MSKQYRIYLKTQMTFATKEKALSYVRTVNSRIGTPEKPVQKVTYIEEGKNE